MWVLAMWYPGLQSPERWTNQVPQQPLIKRLPQLHQIEQVQYNLIKKKMNTKILTAITKDQEYRFTNMGQQWAPACLLPAMQFPSQRLQSQLHVHLVRLWEGLHDKLQERSSVQWPNPQFAKVLPSRASNFLNLLNSGNLMALVEVKQSPRRVLQSHHALLSRGVRSAVAADQQL